MKRIVACLLTLSIILLLCACGTSEPMPTVIPTPTMIPTPTPTPIDRGSELPSYSLKSKADSYVRKQFSGTTYGGYQITKFNIGSSSELTGDDLYVKFSYSGTYDFKNKYGETEHTTWNMKVKVYKWSKNPDNKTEVSYYY